MKMRSIPFYFRLFHSFSALLISIATVSGAVYVKEPFPIADGAYSNGGSIYNTTPVHNDMIGFSGKWDSAGNTSVMQGRSYGLEYPENINLTASHGSMSINNATQGATGAAGRIISRAITEVPITGTLYYSVLIQADSTSLSMLAANQTYGIGFGKTSKMSNSTSTALPYDGVYFGFWKNASGTKGSLDYTSIILRVNGTNYVLLDSPEPGTTYLCVAQIEIGAGTDGAEIVSATVVDPEIPLLFTEERTITVEEELIAETSFTFINAGGLYATGNGFVYFDEIILSDTLEEAANMLDSSMPVLENTMVVLNEEEEFVFSTQIINGSGDIYALLRKAEEYTATNLVASAASNTTVSATLTGLPANTGYEYAALVEWAGSPVLVAGSRSFYTGDVWVEAVSNAEESGYVPGIFKISRDSADSATTFDLQVDYAVSGTAEVGKNYQEMSGTVTIPAGMESVEVEVVPVVDVQSREVTTIVLAILPTAYYTNHLASASLDIEKIQLPEGKNVWIAPEDGKASDASNWSLGRIPTETDTILLDWYSTAAMTWDADTSEELPDTVANWIQTEEYDNTVTFNTYKTGSFKAFTVTGDATLSGGSWKHRRDAGSRQNSPAGLFLVVEGDLVTEENFTFDGLGAGYGNQRGPSGTTHAFVGVSHGGQGGYSSEGPCYGSYLYPDDLGSTSTSTSTGNPGGGGLFNIVVNGTFTHDGTITVKGASAHSYCSHAGGSVYISAGSLLGTGIIDADCGVQAGKRPTGGGGRIAIYTDAESYSEFTNSFKGTITAASGMTTGPQTNAGEMQAFGANGTIYIASLDEDGERTMRLYNRGLAQTSRVDDYYKAAVIRSGETWELDKLILEQTGRVAVSSDGVLSLPSSDSIISDGHANNMVCLDGGSIEFTADGAENLLVADGFSIGVKSDTTLVQGIDINETWNLMFIADDMILAVDRLFNEKRCIPAGEYIVEEINDWADAAVATGEGTVIVLRDQAGTVLRIR